MKIYHDTENLPAFSHAVITIGTFDGVHTGHLQIIRQLLKETLEVDGTAVLITFHPHPKQVVASSKKPIFILNTPEEKAALLAKAGIEHLVVVPFNKAFADQPAEDYISNFLVSHFHPHTIIIGYDHRFGRNREGDYHLLEDRAKQFGYLVKEIPEHVLQDITISSTKIREALLQGDTGTATAFLGYPYFFSGMVKEGNKLGRTIDFPTANLEVEDENKLIPANGVYAVTVDVEDLSATYQGMMNIGFRPTIGGNHRVIEVHIFAFDESIYGKKVTVHIMAKLRDEITFSGLEALKEQLGNDRANAIRALTR